MEVVILFLIFIGWSIKNLIEIGNSGIERSKSKDAAAVAKEFRERFCDPQLEESIRTRFCSCQEQRDIMWNDVYEVISKLDRWDYYSKALFDKRGEDLAVLILMMKQDKIMDAMTGYWNTEMFTSGHYYRCIFYGEKAGRVLMQYIGEHFVKIDPSLQLLVNNITSQADYFWSKSLLYRTMSGTILVSTDTIKAAG